jgi:hypothetical protein
MEAVEGMIQSALGCPPFPKTFLYLHVCNLPNLLFNAAIFSEPAYVFLLYFLKSAAQISRAVMIPESLYMI